LKYLKTEYFISQRIIRSGANKTGLSSGITGIAVAAIALGLAVMIVAVAVVTGFKNEIRDKIIGFGSHIQIVNYDSNVSYETKPIDAYPSYLPAISSNKEIIHLQAFSIKAGIVKTNENIEGLVLKGVNRHFDWSFFKESLISGSIPQYSDSALSNDVLISSYLSKRLNLSTGDEFQMWFVMDSPRFRKFRISGIYETSLQEFDKTFAFVDIQHIQRLNNWEDNQISGYELQIKDFDKLESVSNELSLITAANFFEDGTRLKVINIVERYPQIFDWLNLQNLNVIIIIILMLVVAGFNMISGLIIMILERTNMIGILKALGAENLFIRKIFLYQSAYLILRGLLWGNLLGITLCLIQLKFEVLSLDPSSYYLTTVPVNFSILHLLLINLGTISIILFFLLIPSKIVSSISPAKAIRFN
jgi:lipoprotein-releasing system permease protein